MQKVMLQKTYLTIEVFIINLLPIQNYFYLLES